MAIKKLITSFLILAALTASSALLLSNENWFSGGPSSGPAQITQNGDAGATSLTYNNAFLPAGLQDASLSDQDASSSLDDPNNLTGILTNSLMNNIVASNPDGPQQNANGDDVITFDANNDQMLASVAQSPALQNAQIPNWDLDAIKQKLYVATTSSPDAIAQYSNDLNSIFNENLVSNGIITTVNGSNADSGNIPAIASATDAALTDTVKLQTPQNLADFQKSLVKLLIYQKNALALVESANSGNDPVKNALVFQAEEQKYNDALQDFQDELQKANANGTFSFGKGPAYSDAGWSAKILGFLGVHTAYAVWPTINIPQYALDVWHYAKTTLLQLVKNSLIHFMEQMVIRWISSPNNPKFVQQWGKELSSAFLAAANKIIQQITPNLSPSFGPLVGSALRPQNLGSSIQSSLDVDLANLGVSQRSFYNDFSKGGFNAYFSLLKPDNNFFSATMAAHDAALFAGGSAQQTAQTKVTAGQGSRGNQLCDDKTNPYSTHATCSEGTLNSSGTCTVPNPLAATNPLASPTTQIPADRTDNGGLCADGTDPTVTSPDQITKAMQDAAVKSPLSLIVNGDDITGLVTAMTESVLTTLVNQGLNEVEGGLANALNPSASTVSSNSATVNSAVASNPNLPPAQPLTCSPNPDALTLLLASSSQVSETFVAAGGDATTSSDFPSYTWSGSWPVNSSASSGTLISNVFGDVASGTGATFTVNFTVGSRGTYNYTATVTASVASSTSTNSCQVKITAS